MSEFSLHGKFQNVIFVAVLNGTIFNFHRTGIMVSVNSCQYTFAFPEHSRLDNFLSNVLIFKKKLKRK